MAIKPEGGKIEFVESHTPDLADGDYTLTVTQTIEAKEQIADKQNFSEKFPVTTFRFSILGPRFTLDPQVITSVFPPAGSLGDYSNALPHIVFKRSTLPWERTAIEKDDPKPPGEEIRVSWLVLLLFEDGELASSQPGQEKSKENVKTFTVGELRAPATGKINWPGISPESGQHDGDRLSVIDVPCSCLKQIIPTGDDLRFLTHVRKTQESTGKPGEDESAVVMGSRLPKPGSISCVHLVSVEGRYRYEGKQAVFDYRGAQDGDAIRLVSLKSWRFTCVDKNNNFSALLKHLDRSSSLRLPDPEWSGTGAATGGMVYREIRDAARRYLATGCVPLPHAMRQGNKTVSWYRGPLVPGHNTTIEFSLPIRSADELVYYDDTYGMFDVSYAAAWELGRLLALQSKSFSTSLYRWKRSHAWKIKDADTQLTHLPFSGPTADLELPETVRSWFENLRLLEGVPFHYLVPDERMLPAESIRFFQLDPIWMECLVDGAFSIGRVLQSDHEQDQSHQQNKQSKVSGFLLRSDAVAGWPGLEVDGYDESREDFVPEKLFEINLAACLSDLDNQKISDQLKEKFHEAGINQSLEPWTVETQQWLINSDQQEFKLIKRENNQIDVCLATDSKFLFSIDGGFETELDARDISTELQQAFAAHQEVLLPNSSISALSWLITDSEEKKHFLLQKEDQTLKAYRDYQLPLLRMARLSVNILVCLFEGIVQTVDLHLKPDTLHCGVDKPEGEQKGFRKILRKLTAGNAGKPIDSVPLKEGERRVINIVELADKIKRKTEATEFSAAEFSLEMIEGAEKVRFSLKS